VYRGNPGDPQPVDTRLDADRARRAGSRHQRRRQQRMAVLWRGRM